MDSGVTISLVVAMEKHTRVIGTDGDLPWHLSDDLRHLRKLTLGKTVILGRKTQESILKRLGHPLPDRRTIILTKQRDYNAEGSETASSWEEAMRLLKNESEVFILGGAQIYRLALPFARTIYLTLVETDIEGDATFPEFDETSWDWKKIEDHAKNEKNEFNFSVWKLTRKEAKK